MCNQKDIYQESLIYEGICHQEPAEHEVRGINSVCLTLVTQDACLCYTPLLNVAKLLHIKFQQI